MPDSPASGVGRNLFEVPEEQGKIAPDDAVDAVAWHDIAATPEFARLETARRRVTGVLLGVFVVAFGTFLILCAYARPFMRGSVDGGLTVAYAWLLGLTVLAWVLVWIYLRVAEGPLAALAQRALEGSGYAAGTTVDGRRPAAAPHTAAAPAGTASGTPARSSSDGASAKRRLPQPSPETIS